MPEKLYSYIWTVSPRRQILLIVLTVMVFPLSMVPLELQRRIIDDAVTAKDLDLLLLLGGGYVAFMVVHGSLKFLMNLQRGRIVQASAAHLREAVYYCIYSVVPPEKWKRDEHPGVDQGTVISMLSSEVEKLGQFIGGSFSVPILQGGTMIAVLGYMIWVEPAVALIGFAVYAPQMIIVPLMQQRINSHNQDYVDRVRRLGDFIVENAENAKRSKDVPRKFRALVDQMFGAKMSAEQLKFLMKFIRNFINHLGPLSILVVGGWFVMNGRTEIGAIVAFLSGFERLSTPWSELIAFYREVSNAKMKYRMLVKTFPTRSVEGEVPKARLA